MTIVLLESLLPSPQDSKNMLASSFDAILQTSAFEEVSTVLEETDRAVQKGYTAFGFVSYEAGFSFLPSMPRSLHPGLPLVWFALAPDRAIEPVPQTFFDSGEALVTRWRLSKTPVEYRQRIETIRGLIEAGDTYQVNFTMRYRGNLSGTPRSLYRELRRKQPVNYAAYIESEDWAILSLSPELFFRRIGNRMVTRPMKGTAPRGRNLVEDRRNALLLQESAKERAENLMIVDLLRNDLGKICAVGSVQVTRAMEIERYETLLQMTSTIEGELCAGATLTDIFRAMFPCGSVTGAPKVRTMRIIDRLEQEPRGIYTGAIGFHSREESVFNVAIRTAFVKAGNLEMGIGSGILHEANPEREYAECVLKAQFFTLPAVDFQLIETILWTPADGYRNLVYHLERLAESSDYFGFADAIPKVKIELDQLESTLAQNEIPQRVRLLVALDGSFNLEHRNLEPIGQLPVRIRFSKTITDSSDRYLFHKTTNRTTYDEQLSAAREEGFFDAIFRNEKQEITEGAISNLLIRKGDLYFTPPVSSGLLAGTYRRYLLQSETIAIEERILKEQDLRNADEVFVCNAIRGLLPAIMS